MIKQLSASSILIFALVLAGCDLSGKKAPPSGSGTSGASFEVLAVDGKMFTDQVDPVFLTPKSRLFNMTACMIDNLYRKQIANQRFTVWDQQGNLIADRVSDDHGCLTWQERPRLNYFAKSEYIFQTRTLRGEGSARGEVKLPIAMNPWLHGETGLIDPVVDLNHAGVSSYNAVATSFVSEQKSYLWLENVDLQNIHEAKSETGGLVFEGRIQIPAQFLTKDTHGTDVAVPIPSGKYKAEFTLFVESGENRNQEVLDRIFIDGLTAEKSLITKDIRFSLPHIPESGVYRIGLKLIPVEGPATLGEFQGTFDLGNVDAFLWSGNATAKLSSEVYGKSGTFSLTALDAQIPNVTAGAPSKAYHVDPLVTCMFDRVEVETETAIHRTIIYRTQFCIRRMDNQKPRKNIMIHVKRNRGDEIDVPTNDNGCVDFEDKISHNFFEPECRQISTAHLSNKELGLDEDAPLQLNPWHGYGTFCRDARIVSREELSKIEDPAMCKATRPKTELFIDAFDMNLQEVNYEVDNNLNLTTKRKVILGINMRTSRPSNQLDGRGLVEPLRQGLYLLRWVMIRNGYEDPNKAYNYMDGDELVVRSNGGRLMHQIWVKLKDARTLDSRNRILIEVSTIDEHKVEKVGDEYRPKAGYSIKDIEVEAGLPRIIYEGNFETKANGYVLVIPFDLKKLDGTAKPQLDAFKGWTDRGLVTPDASLFPDHFESLKDMIAMGREIERLQGLTLSDIRNSYETLQDLKEVHKGESLTEALPYDKFIETMNSKQPEWYFHSDLCKYWARQQIPEVMKEFGVEGIPNAFKEEFRVRCLTARNSGLGSWDLLHWIGIRNDIFLVYQNILRAEEAKYVDTLPLGRNYNISVGEQFSMGSRFVNTTDATFKLPIGKIPVVGEILEMGFGLSNTSTFRSDHGTDMTFGSSTLLRAEESTLKLSLSKYRRCMVIRMNPSITKKMSYWRVMLNQIGDEVKRAQAERTLAQRGIEVCGPLETEPLPVEEKYFYVQTQLAPGSLQDPADLRNRSYSLQIRGMRDMSAFLQLGRSQITNPDTMGQDPKSFEAWTSNMEETFQAVTPASPGVILEDIYY
jgi:hypothetical protein